MANRLLEALKNVVPWQVQAVGKSMASLISFAAMILLALWLVGALVGVSIAWKRKLTLGKHSSNGSKG